MALTSIGGIVSLPAKMSGVVVTSGQTTLNATAEKAGAVFVATVTGDITAIGFRTATVTTGKTLKVGIQSLASGLPSGTYLGAGAGGYGTQAIADTDDNLYFTVTLGAAVPVTAGQQYAVVVEWNDDGDFGNLNIVHHTGPVLSGLGTLYGHYTSYPVGKTSAAWAVYGNTYAPMFSLSYGGTYHLHPTLCAPQAYLAILLEADGAVYDETGNRFQVPVKCRCVGISAYLDPDTNATYSLFPDSGAALATISLSATNRVDTATGLHVGFFATPVELEANTWYRVAAFNTSNTGFNLGNTTYGVAAAMAQDGLANCYRCSRKDAGAWDDTATTQRVAIFALIDQIDSGGSAGGGRPEFRGGNL